MLTVLGAVGGDVDAVGIVGSDNPALAWTLLWTKREIPNADATENRFGDDVKGRLHLVARMRMSPCLPRMWKDVKIRESR